MSLISSPDRVPDPNREQERLAGLPVGNVLVIAPAGCGKTEGLAQRVKTVIARGDVRAPSMVLALTFSNKAKSNLASRIRGSMGPEWRQRVVVTNFHGLAARIVRAHGRLLGISADVSFPEEPWRRKQLRALGITYNNRDIFESALREAKNGAWDDDEVMECLVGAGIEEAIEYERILRNENRLDYDDLIRHAARLLANAAVSRLYQCHFGLTLVDEVQDLSVLQLSIARSVGGDRVTYAGDEAQGIYSFAGAEPSRVLARIHGLHPEIVEFDVSYRSAPAVLRAVNVLAREMGSTELVCGLPEKWPDGGRAIYVERGDTIEEARTILGMVDEIMVDETATIGVICRRGSRVAELRQAADEAGVSYEDWGRPTHIPRVVELLKRNLRAAMAGSNEPGGIIDRLEIRCRDAVDESDALTLAEIAEACAMLREMTPGGASVVQAVESCRSSSEPDAAVSSGLHFLTGHRGKGQEFDWVFVLGLEDGHVPDFRSEGDPEELRVLHVMVSRARYAAVFTLSRRTMTRAGWRETQGSRWLPLLRTVETTADIQ